MIEYAVNENLEIINRVPIYIYIYIGGYCIVNGSVLRNGIGYLVDKTFGGVIRESEWKNGKEKKRQGRIYRRDGM